MAKWIQAAKTVYDLDSDTQITLKGDVDNLYWFEKYKYTVYIGSGGTEFEVASDKTASDFSGDGFGFNIKTSGDDNFAKIATPTGQSCYIRAVGKTKSKTVEYRTYITLKAPSIEPGGFTLSVSAVNNKVSAFPANCAVVGFSNLQLVIDNITLEYSSWIKKISFSTSFFKDIEYTGTSAGAKNGKQTITSEIVDKSGEFTLYCTVTNNFGYSSTKEITFHISDYGAPTLEFKKGGEPARTCDANGTALERKDAKKDWKYGFRMGLTVKPYSVINLNGNLTVFNKIVTYASPKKAYITLTDLRTKKVAYFQSSSETKASIDTDGILTTEYLSGSTSSTVGYPIFNGGKADEECGLRMHHAYLLKVLVKDSTGTVYTLTARVPSMSTTLHLRKGGRGLSIGGYSEGDDDLFESYWKFKCHDSIEAADTVKGNKVEASSEFILNDTTVNGIGTGKNQLASGNHGHGIIKSDGTVGTPDAVIVSDSAGKICAVTQLSKSNIPMETKNQIIQSTTEKGAGCFTNNSQSLEDIIKEFNQLGIFENNIAITINEGYAGSEEAGVCYANHVHPYSREWAKDPLIVKLISAVCSGLTNYL